MNILSDKPSELKEKIGEDIRVEYSPALDMYTPNNKILRTLKGMYFSSKLDLDNQELVDYIRETAKPTNLPEPTCHTCYNYTDFDNFCKKYIDTSAGLLRLAYDVETTAAPYLSNKYKLAGFSLANSVSDGCYVILESLDYTNPDINACLDRLANILKENKVLVFNAQHEYIATKKCVGVDLAKETKHLDDAYSMALLLKTESFKADVFKLKVLCNRLLGINNWATIIDDYIDIVMRLARIEELKGKKLSDLSKDDQDLIKDYISMLTDYGYTTKEIVNFIHKIQESFPDWKEQNTIPYTLIPSKMISVYGCYDSCYLVALFDYLNNWAEELADKLSKAINKPDIPLAYQETIDGQIMSAILTLNGIKVDEKRDNEVKAKSKILSEKYYNELWNITSDTTGKNILREFVKIKNKEKLEKTYILPLKIEELIPEGFKFIKTTPSFYSFECRVLTEEAKYWAEEVEELKPCGKYNNHYKLLQKHLKPYSTLPDEDELLDSVVDKYLQDCLEKDGTLAKNGFKPMSGPKEIYNILNDDFNFAHFLDRVILYEYENLPEKEKDKQTSQFLEEHLLYNFNEDIELYTKVAHSIKNKVINYVKKQYPYKEVYENLLSEGIKSFASPIIAYIYNVFTATGCSVDEPKYSVFRFICQLKICRKYLRIGSTFIQGSSGGYASQMQIKNSSINKEFLELNATSVLDDETGEPIYTEDTSNLIFGSWYASCADTGRWTATVHNIPAGAFCKRRLVSRYPGGVILAADMSQMEVRELAVLSKCQKLIDICKDASIDMHKRTASLAFDVPYDNVNKTQRKQAKEGVFSVVYGRDESSLAQNLFKGDKASAKRLMDSIFKVFPEIPDYLERAHEDVDKYGYLVTRRGAPIFLNPFTSKGKDSGQQALYRKAQNYAIQGGASYICTDTLVNVQKLIDKYNMNDKIKICCYIHDSIEIDCAPDVIDMGYRILYAAFNTVAPKLYGVPTKGDVVIGVSMGNELDMQRVEKNHYIIEGNKSEIDEVVEQMSPYYIVNTISKEVGETENYEQDVNWIFTPRAELRWHDEKTPATYEIVLEPKLA